MDTARSRSPTWTYSAARPPDGATIGWVHFLAFDVFVARWAYLDSQARSLSAWLMAPVLFLTLMLGPMGLLVYLVLRGRR